MNRTIYHLALKQEQRGLIEAAGGLVKAAEVCGLRKSHVQRIQDPNTSFHFTTLQIALLETHTGKPMVTEIMAAIAGREMVASDNPIPFQFDLEDHANEVVQQGAGLVSAIYACLRGQKSPRLVSGVICAIRRKKQTLDRMLEQYRAIQARHHQQET